MTWDIAGGVIIGAVVVLLIRNGWPNRDDELPDALFRWGVGLVGLAAAIWIVAVKAHF